MTQDPNNRMPRKARGSAPHWSRRTLLASAALAPMWTWGRRAAADSGPPPPTVIELSPDDKRRLYNEIAAAVVPQDGYQSRIALRDSLVRCVDHGVIDRAKFFDLRRRGLNMAADLSHVLDNPSDRPIRLTRENAAAYVNLLPDYAATSASLSSR